MHCGCLFHRFQCCASVLESATPSLTMSTKMWTINRFQMPADSDCHVKSSIRKWPLAYVKKQAGTPEKLTQIGK